MSTTREIADSIQVSEDTVRRWARLGLLPPGRKVHRGRRGVGFVWPAETAAQARWVKSQLDAGLTPDDVRAALTRGDFAP
ncbi:MAG: MerR family transcriptional regulator [Myxococcales bacterium]|nr:MerR family transcriptional regulator [Myxococcales bacterium]